MRFSQKLKHHFFSREFLLFLLVGCINTFNCSLIAGLLAFYINANLAFNAGYLLSLGIAYVLNSLIIFRQAMHFKACLKFALSYLPNYLIQNIIVFLFFNQLAFPPLFSYLLAAVIGVPATFLFVKIFAFGQK